jgi:hypothetical protein
MGSSGADGQTAYAFPGSTLPSPATEHHEGFWVACVRKGPSSPRIGRGKGCIHPSSSSAWPSNAGRRGTATSPVEDGNRSRPARLTPVFPRETRPNEAVHPQQLEVVQFLPVARDGVNARLVAFPNPRSILSLPVGLRRVNDGYVPAPAVGPRHASARAVEPTPGRPPSSNSWSPSWPRGWQRHRSEY